MKKTFITLAIIFGLSLCSIAQNGGLFGYGQASVEEDDDYYTAWYAFGQEQDPEDNSLFRFLKSGNMPGLPNHNESENQEAPLGSGALLLIGFGAAYALKKRNNK